MYVMIVLGSVLLTHIRTLATYAVSLDLYDSATTDYIQNM